MGEVFSLQTPLWEIAARGTMVYLVLAVVVRLMPKRHAGNLSPNDLIAMVIVGALAADAIIGDARTVTDILLMVVVVLVLDYAFNIVEYYVPRFRRIAQDTPTLLIHNGQLLRRNLRHEKLTEQELMAALRKDGIEEIGQVKQAILEVDGHISVIRRDD